MRNRVFVSVLALALTGAITSCDDTIAGIEEGFDQTADWRADMNAANEIQTPAVNSPATGRAWFTDHGNTITYFIEVSGLVAPMTAAHIHRGTATENGAIMVPLTVVAGERAGRVSGTIDMRATDISAEPGVQTPAELRQLMNTGGAYVNVHTSSGTVPEAGYPAGEIRGQVRQN
jgi:hypothetical protein